MNKILEMMSVVIGGLVATACSGDSFQNVFPEPSYVKINSGTQDYAYPDDELARQELVLWYRSLSEPLELAPVSQQINLSSKPLELKGQDFSAKLGPYKTELSTKGKDGKWRVFVRPVSRADVRMKSFLESKKLPDN